LQSKQEKHPSPYQSKTHQLYNNMWFCPLDGTLLQIVNSSSHEASSAHIFSCPTCPYSQQISQPQIQRTYSSTRKKVDDILGGEKAWENVDRTMAVCPQCSFGEAYFMQMQIRSADEPMSVFYKCVKCSNQWNDK
jgi:DNA-directed RNA polymerase III subunit RPC11